MKHHTTNKKSNQSSHDLPYTVIPLNISESSGIANYIDSVPALFLPKINTEGCSKPQETEEGKERVYESDGQYMDIHGLTSYIKRTKGSIRNLVLRRAIPYRKQAGRLIFLKDEIDEWLKTAPGKTLDEIKNDT